MILAGVYSPALFRYHKKSSLCYEIALLENVLVPGFSVKQSVKSGLLNILKMF